MKEKIKEFFKEFRGRPVMFGCVIGVACFMAGAILM